MALFAPKKDSDIDNWLLTYSDMVTLILCFFVLLAAMSNVDMVKFEQIKTNMARTIGDKEVLSPIETVTMDLKKDIASLGIENDALVYDNAEGAVLEFSSPFLFASGAAKIKPEAVPFLKRIAATLSVERFFAFTYEVEGHTDESSDELSALDLSALRAAALAQFFISRGIDASRFRVVGLADTRPKVPDVDRDGSEIVHNKILNRRLVVKIEPM